MMMQIIAVSLVALSATASAFHMNIRIRGPIGSSRSLNMLTVDQEIVLIKTPTGDMKTTILKPSGTILANLLSIYYGTQL